MTEKQPTEFGLYITREHPRYTGDGEGVAVSVVRRSQDRESILNCSWGAFECIDHPDKRHRGRCYADLEMRGHAYVGSDGAEWIGFEPRYAQVYAVELEDAQRMVKTLKAWEVAAARWRKDNAWLMRPADAFRVLAKLVGAKFAVFQDLRRVRTNTYAEMEWNFLGLEGGSGVYAYQVQQVLESAYAKKQQKERVS